MLGGVALAVWKLCLDVLQLARLPKNWESHIVASHLHRSIYIHVRQPLVKGEGMVRCDDANAVMDSWVRAKACVGNAVNAGL